MGNIKCCQCGYFRNEKCGKQCSRYSILVDKDNICVDSDEMEDTDNI